MKNATTEKQTRAGSLVLAGAASTENATMTKITYTFSTAKGETVKPGVLLVIQPPSKVVGKRLCQVKLDDEPTPRWVPVKGVDFVC